MRTDTATPMAMKRYHLVLPEGLFDEVQMYANRQQTTVVDVFRKFIKLGLLAAQIEDDPEAALLIRQGNTEREIILL